MPSLETFSHAFRKLERSPLFFLAGATTFALGIALAVTIASLYRAVLVQPLPFKERLVVVGRTTVEQPKLGAPRSTICINRCSAGSPLS
jgi:hypothetical protein